MTDGFQLPINIGDIFNYFERIITEPSTYDIEKIIKTTTSQNVRYSLEAEEEKKEELKKESAVEAVDIKPNDVKPQAVTAEEMDNIDEGQIGTMDEMDSESSMRDREQKVEAILKSFRPLIQTLREAGMRNVDMQLVEVAKDQDLDMEEYLINKESQQRYVDELKKQGGDKALIAQAIEQLSHDNFIDLWRTFGSLYPMAAYDVVKNDSGVLILNELNRENRYNWFCKC